MQQWNPKDLTHTRAIRKCNASKDYICVTCVLNCIRLMYVCNSSVSHGGEKGVGLGDVWTPETERSWPKGWTRLSYW